MNKKEIKIIAEKYPLGGFLCGSCGHTGELILISGERWIVRKQPSSDTYFRYVKIKCYYNIFNSSLSKS